MSEGGLGQEQKKEYLSCISLSTLDRSRAQNFSSICQVEEEREDIALR